MAFSTPFLSSRYSFTVATTEGNKRNKPFFISLSLSLSKFLMKDQGPAA